MLMHRLSRHEKAATQRAHRADLHSLYRLRWQRFEFAADEGRHAEGVEYATLEWGYCFNHRRLLEPIGNILPAEAEVKFVAALSVELGLSDAERQADCHCQSHPLGEDVSLSGIQGTLSELSLSTSGTPPLNVSQV